MLSKLIKIALPILAGCLFATAVYHVAVTGRESPKPPAPIAHPPISPFDNAVAGAGLVEASTENVAIGAVTRHCHRGVRASWTRRPAWYSTVSIG